MKDRDLNKEFELLDNYFKGSEKIEVKLITFNNAIVVDKTYNIKNADWSLLKSELKQSSYDGVAMYNILLKGYNSATNLLFTDGIETIDKLVVSTKQSTFIVNSSETANHKVLQKQSIRSQANYIDLTEVTLAQSLMLLKKENSSANHTKSDFQNESVKIKLKDAFILISGNVSDANGPLNGATISVNDKVGTTSDANGNYQLEVRKNDYIVVSYLGHMSKKLFTNEYDTTLDIFLDEDENELKEVVVKGEVEVEDEFEETGNGNVDKKKIGFAVQSIDDEEISETITDVTNVAQGKFSISHNGEDLSRTVLRGFVSITYDSYPLIILDGVPVRKAPSTKTPWLENVLASLIDPDNIEKITILKGLAATNRWGSGGAGGVILITSKTSNYGNSKTTKQTSSLVRNNVYKENLTLANSAIKATYIDDLKKYKSLNDVYAAYLKQRVDYFDDPNYFLNVSDFISQWRAKDLASSILSNIVETNTNKVDLLRLVAYKAEQNYDYLLAKKIYERIVLLRPNEAQSYRDLALIYQETGYYEKSLDLYNDIMNGNIINVNFSGLIKNIESEFRRLVTKHKQELTFSKIPKKYLNEVNQDARIVFDWNNKNALFELQFVNPQKLFFTWSHTKSKNAKRLNDEKVQGFNSEEFLLIDAEKGDWLINLESKSKKTLKSPLLLKYTVYYNYGKDNERKELKTIVLNSIKGKQMIGKIVI